MSDQVLELEGVTTEFRTGWGRAGHVLTAMDDISFAVCEGETLGLVGESGSGKTTTGAVALGLRKPTRGVVRFLGRPFDRRRGTVGQIQAVFQNPQWSLNPRMTVGASVVEPLSALGRSAPGPHTDTVLAMLDEVGLHRSVAERYPHELSGGQRQRVAVARALITRPRFIVFDEAVSALDVSVQAQVLNLVKDLQAENGFAALFISHDLGAVRYVAHRIAVMRQGSVVELADTERFYEAPSHAYSRQLLEGM
jgi:ABC-type glutathione transport system ATPase component